MGRPAFRIGVTVKDGELRVDSPFRELIIRGWPELTARTKARWPWRVVVVPPPKRVEPETVVGEELLHRLGPCEIDEIRFLPGARWKRCCPELDLARALIMPVGCFVHAQARRWRTLASAPEPYEEPPGGRSPAWLARRQQARRTVAAYFANVPEEVRRAVEPFWFGQWQLLVLAQRCPGALELIHRNPALAFCLAVLTNSQDRPPFNTLRAKRRLVRKTDAEICSALGFARPELAALLLSRTPPAACFDSGMWGLRRMRKSDCRNRLAELPAVTDDLLSLMTLPAILRQCTTPLLLELAARPPASERNYAGRIWGIFRMTDRRFGTAAGDSLKLESLRQVETLYAKLAKHARRYDRNDGDDRE